VVETAAVEPTGSSTPPPSVPPAGFTVSLTPVLEIDEPVDLIVHPVTEEVFVASRTGVIARVDLEAGEITEELVDLGGRLASDWVEQGVLGIEFSPAGDVLYVNFTDSDGTTVVAGWDTDGTTIDLESGRTVLRVDQPAGNHNGGDLEFGPDGLLYITLGDGGGAGDEFENGQDTSTLLGSILRIDPDGGEPYAIPATNPFVDGGGAPEIYLMGARNPWRIDFDDATGDLWIADVGQDAVEEINVVPAGTSDAVNMGWPLVEGSVPFSGSGPPEDGYLAPIAEYSHDEGCSITGGVVYRGSAIPELSGVYLFADYCTAELWGVVGTGQEGPAERIDLGVGTGPSPAAFAEGPGGEVYVLSLEDRIARIDPA
jgi:glucose/arabinose dehydrogenase